MKTNGQGFSFRTIVWDIAMSTGFKKLKQVMAYLYGVEAYVYGFPLVMMDVTKAVLTATPKSGEYKAPIDQFARIRTYVNPGFKDVVRVSRDSLWSHAFVDLGKEPLIYSQPDTKGRYVVMQALNMWTDNFASVGSRTTGTESGHFLIAGPQWNGKVPPDIKQTFRCSTRFAWVLVQIWATSPDDYKEIHALQDELKLTPLSAWGTPYTPPDNVPVEPTADITATPYDQVRLMTGEAFFKRLAMLLKDNPPYQADAPMLKTLKNLGVEPGKEFDINNLDWASAKGLNRAPAQVWLKLAAGPYEAATVNGWQKPLNLGRYGTDYITRTFVAWIGLGALISDDVVYPSAFVDGDGKILDGANEYLLHFGKDEMLPSNSGLWSISPYRENFYVRNSIERYEILSKMPLHYNGDGSLDVYIQSLSPGANKEANWLPCPPSGPFNLTIRVYQPKQAMLDGTYKIPPVRKVK